MTRILVVLAVCVASAAWSQVPHDLEDWVLGGCKHQHGDDLFRRVPPNVPIDRATRPIDVQHVELGIAFRDTTAFIDARMEARVVLLADASAVDFDFESETTASLGMRVTGAWVDGDVAPFTHEADTLRVLLPGVVAAGDTTTVAVTYEGRPVEAIFPGYGLRATNFLDEEFQSDPERPVLQTLSQPVGARTWWPSHDHPADGATVRLVVTCPPGFDLAAPGIRESTETLGDGRVRQTNYMPHPIPSYLVSMIVADFERWTETIEVDELLPGGTTQSRSMELVYYAPAPRRADAEYTWQNTGAMLGVFENLWGPYPYADVKYGNALFQGSVAMEHPTLSSIGDSPFTLSDFPSSLYDGPSGELVNAHEVAHQWFGDAVHVDRWGDIWLNEGFARYAEVIWLEEFYGPQEARDYLDVLRDRQEFWSGTLRDPDALFSLVTYNRGALTLHMLRQILGRDGLFTAMRNYVTDPALRFGSVTIEDFQAHCEAVFGESMDWFFTPWLTREALPAVSVQWTPRGDTVAVEIRQDPLNTFELPLPLRFELAGGATQNEIAWIGRGTEVFRFDVPAAVVGLQVDPERDWLVEVGSIARPEVSLLQARPNPFDPTGEGTEIRYEVRGTADLRIDVIDARGRRVRTWRIESAPPGEDFVLWEGKDDGGHAVASGVYYVQLQGAGRTLTSKLTLVR